MDIFFNTIEINDETRVYPVTPMTDEDKHIAALSILGLQQEIFRQNVAMGWWDEGKQRRPAESLCLIHSEISEAMEGLRKNLMDDHLPHRKMVEVELAGGIIRILDLAHSLGLDVGEAMVEKLAYNATRADHQREHRDSENGKKF